MTTVLGGGLSGLSAAYYLLRRAGLPITIYESANRLGGWIRTEKQKDKGFIFEAGPRTIRSKGPSGANTLELIAELQIPIDAIPSHAPAAKNRMIFAKGQLCPLPNSINGVLKTLPPFSESFIKIILNDLKAKRKTAKHGDESIYDFISRRFGAELADYAISPLICGICAGNAKEISVRFLLNDIFEKEQRWGGVIKGMLFSKFSEKKQKEKSGPGIFGDHYEKLLEQVKKEKWSMYRVQGGLETLPKTLGHYLCENAVNIQLSAECQRLNFTKDNNVKMIIRGQEAEADYLISSLPSFKLANCVRDQHPSLAAQLDSIPYVNVAVVNLQYNSKDLLKHNAFGFLVPPIERLPILGVIFDSCVFDMHGNTVLTVMMGGSWFEEHFGKSPSQKELLDIALQHVEKILHINHEPKLSRVHILNKCIPQYTVGHKKRVEGIRNYINRYKLPLSVCGAAYDGVGINDVILSARTQVEMLQEV